MNALTPLSLVDIVVDDNERRQLLDVLDTRWLTCGPKTMELERDFAAFIGTRYAVAVSSGTAALQVALAQQGLRPGDEVIITPFTWWTTIGAVMYAGGTPVLADIEEASGNISARTCAARASSRTKGIVVVHYAGWPVHMTEIMQLAQERSWFVIEDSAHAVGSSLHGKKTGSLGDIGCFSFGSTKLITTGEGGMLTTNDPESYRTSLVLRNYGETVDSWRKHSMVSKDYDITHLSYNFKMNELGAAMGIAQCQKLDYMIERRKAALQEYRAAFSRLKNVKILFCSDDDDYSTDVVPLFLPILLAPHLSSRRKELMEVLASQGIESTIQYPMPYTLSIGKQILHEQTSVCPVAEDVSNRVLSLPCHTHVTPSHVNLIAEILERFTNS